MFPSIIPCWRHSCPGDQHYQKTVTSLGGRERLVYRCTDCSHTVEIAPEEVSEYAEDFAETNGELRALLANALARVTFDQDGVRIA